MQLAEPVKVCSLLEAICRLLQRPVSAGVRTQIALLLEEVCSCAMLNEPAKGTIIECVLAQAFKAACGRAQAREELLLFATR